VALAAKDIPITRADVQGWIEEWKDLDHASDATLEDWIRGKVAELELGDPMVNTFAHEFMPDETHVADMIIADLESYATGN